MDAAVGESSNAKDPDVVEVEVARGERDDLLDEQQTLRSDRARIRGKPCSRLPSRSAKVPGVSQILCICKFGCTARVPSRYNTLG